MQISVTSHSFIWGLIDQGNQSYAFSVFESESGAERPGLFHLRILGVGHIAASAGSVRVAELRGGTLVRESLSVFEGGPVRTLLQAHIVAAIRRIRARIPGDTYDYRGHWDANRPIVAGVYSWAPLRGAL